MNISTLISNSLVLPIKADHIRETVSVAFPELNKAAHATIVAGLYNILDENRWSIPDVYRFQLEKVLGECHNFQEWFDLDARQKLEFFIQVEKFLMETDLTGDALADEVYYMLYLYKESTMPECNGCGHTVEDKRLGDLCARCTHEEFEQDACSHCGEREVDLDADNLCSICSYEQWHYDEGKCPVCETPSPGSRACSGCSRIEDFKYEVHNELPEKPWPSRKKSEG